MNRTPTPEEREMYNLPVDGKLFTHNEYEKFAKWLKDNAERLEARSKQRGEQSEMGKYEAERARAYRFALEALTDIHLERNEYRYR